jgi:hypothetical protein
VNCEGEPAHAKVLAGKNDSFLWLLVKIKNRKLKIEAEIEKHKLHFMACARGSQLVCGLHIYTLK